MEDFDPTFTIPADVGSTASQVVKRKIDAWISSEWFVDLIHMFGGVVTDQGTLREKLETLEVFSERWDFRRQARERGVATDDAVTGGTGAARWLTSAVELSPEDHARILRNAQELGLVEAHDPTQPFYDYLVALGGARLSCQLRPLRAAEVIQNGVRTRRIALLGAARPIPDSEREATDTYAPGAVDEFDLIVAGGQQAFGFDPQSFDEERYEHPDNANLSWLIRRFKASTLKETLPIVAISAPSSDPERRRANSADTLRFLLDKERISSASRLLLITSQIYVPYVQLEALRTIGLPRALFIETIGFPGHRMSQLQGLTLPHHYLQEIRSAIQAARRFCLEHG